MVEKAKRFFYLQEAGKLYAEWECKKCGCKRSNKTTHKHGQELKVSKSQ